MIRPHMTLRPSAFGLALLGCGVEAEPVEMVPPSPRQLVDVEGWVEVAPGEDPFAPPSPIRIECDPVEGFGTEQFGGYLVFEVLTGVCKWATVEQPLLEDVAAGELFRPRLWHFELTSPEPAEGYAAVAIDGRIVWEYRVSIPSPSALVRHSWVADQDIPAGTPVQFHVDNHGINSWNLVEITAEIATDDEETG
jgi:hypothetical protein